MGEALIVRRGGGKEKIIQNFYDNGLEYVSWEEGFSDNQDGVTQITKESSNITLYMQLMYYDTGEISLITSSKVSVKDIKTIYMDCEFFDESYEPWYVLGLYNYKTGYSYDSVVHLAEYNSGRRTIQIDVSNLSGEYFIGVYLSAWAYYQPFYLKIYKVWGEG